MEFVGREKEIKQIKGALEEGKNVIIYGKYGIGRTSLIKQVAEIMKKEWRFLFLDFSETPGKICKYLLRILWPNRGYYKKAEFSKYRSARFQIINLDLKDNRKHVLVFDNVAKLTPQKMNFIRYLAWEKKFQFVAIVENFVSKDDFIRLRVGLYPAEMINIKHLSKKEVYKFYQDLSERYKLYWTEVQIKKLAEITSGYPLRMNEIALRELGAMGFIRKVL